MPERPVKTRAEKRKSELGFEAQKLAAERHALKKDAAKHDSVPKDIAAHIELSNLADKMFDLPRKHAGFEAQFDALAKDFGVDEARKEAETKAAQLENRLGSTRSLGDSSQTMPERAFDLAI